MALGFKTGGRQKGSQNHRLNLHAKCEAIGLDVFSKMLELAKADDNADKQFSKLREIAQYLYAKPKEVEEKPLTPEQLREALLSVVNGQDRGA